MTAWTDFVQKIHDEGKVKDSNYSFKQAMKDASERKGEMGSPSTSIQPKNKTKKMRKGKKSKKVGKSKKSRKLRKSRKH